MKRLIFMFLMFGATLIFFSCSENNPSAPELNQNDQVTTLAKKPAPTLSCTIEYVFVGHLGTTDAEGRLLVWDGLIHGEIEGIILWWFVLDSGPPNMPDQAHVGFYEARWEIWVGGNLVLAGESAGTTAQPKEKDGIWRGEGIVTEANAGFEDWNGRHMNEGGNVNWTFPYSGEGIFRIN